MSTIELRGVSKTFREGGTQRRVLSDVDATWSAGELVVLLGRSGSGKSTLLNLLSGLDRPDKGAVTVDGVRLETLSEGRTRFRREAVGFVFQSFNLIPTLTAGENVRLPLELLGWRPRDAESAARALLEEVGLADRMGTFPDRLSGGEQQRIAVARALAHAPKVVLADEPTGDLDHRSGEQVMALLDRLSRGSGKTLVVVTHDAELAARANRVLTLEEGRLVERAPP